MSEAPQQQGREGGGCKLFCGGLSFETTGDKLRSYMENFGSVREAFVSYNRANGRPRGFGFVVFLDDSVAAKVVATKHTIDRREVDVKYAVPKDETLHTDDQSAAQQHARNDAVAQGKKIFVGGLAPTVDDKALREHFAEFGAVDDAVVMHDHDKRPRGFGFITFSSEESVAAVFARGAMQTIHGKGIEVKPAVPRDLMPPSVRGQQAMLYLDPRFSGHHRHHYKAPHMNSLQHGLARDLIPTIQPGHFNSMSAALAMQAAAGYSLQNADYNNNSKAPPGGLDLYSGINGNGGVFGPSARAALAYNLASLQAQAHLNGLPASAASAASGKLSTVGPLGPAANGLNLKALALAGGFGAAFPGSGGLGAAGGDSSNYSDQQQGSLDYPIDQAASLAVTPEFGYHNANAFAATQTPGWSS